MRQHKILDLEYRVDNSPWQPLAALNEVLATLAKSSVLEIRQRCCHKNALARITIENMERITFTVWLPDGTLAKAQAVTTVSLLASVLRSLVAQYPDACLQSNLKTNNKN